MLNYSQHNMGSDEVPLVLLHGFLESSTMWEHVQFPSDYPMVKIDLPGHGKSTDPDLLCDTMQEMAKAVMKVVDELQLSRYHLIGHSMGGYVGLEVKRMDARLNKVMLLNSNFWADSSEKVNDRKRVANIVQSNRSHFIYEVIPNLFVNPELFDSDVKALIAEALEISPEAIASASIAMSKRSNNLNLVRENVETFTIVQGGEDPIARVEQMRELLEGVNVNYIELEEVGHMAHFEANNQLGEIIENFVKTTES